MEVAAVKLATLLIEKIEPGVAVPMPTFPFAAIESRATFAVPSKKSSRPAPPLFPEPVERRSRTRPPTEELSFAGSCRSPMTN